MALIMSSCAVTTKSSEGTTETFHNTTDASSELTSSTSPRAEESARDLKIKAFAAATIQRLQEDMARGGGEHLASFAYLLGIGTSHRPEFYALIREKYPVLFRNPVTPEQLVARLDTELDAYPQWRR
jgi:hypothetical protein